MKMVNIAEAKAQLSELVELAATGERIVICKRNQPVAEMHPIAAPRTSERRLGLSPGSALMLPAFFDPLPADIVADFEHPAGGAATGRRPHVAEPRPGSEAGAPPRPVRGRRKRS